MRKSRLPYIICSGDTRARQARQTVNHPPELVFPGGVVADPEFEQIAEDVEGIGGARLAGEEIEKQPRDGRSLVAEMQVGNEERRAGHGPLLVLDDLDAFDHDVVHRHVLVAAACRWRRL